MKKQIAAIAFALTIAGGASGSSIQFNMGDGTAYNGNNAPAGLTDTVWNSVTGDTTSGLLYSDGSAATGVTLDVGLAAEIGPGGTVEDWTDLYGDFRNTFTISSALGIFETTLMQKYWLARDYRTLAVRITGLEAGEYDVYSLVRADNLAITYDVAVGVNSGAWTNLAVQSIAAVTGTEGTDTWAEGLNYTKHRVTVTGTNDYITVMVDSTANAYSPLQGLQIVAPSELPVTTIQVDFGATGGPNGTTTEGGTIWNGVEPGSTGADLPAGGAYVVNDLVDSSNHVTTVTMTLDWSSQSGLSSSKAWDLHEADRDGDFLGIQAADTSSTGVYNTITFSNLTAGAPYDVTVWSQAVNGGDFRVNGGAVQVLVGTVQDAGVNGAVSHTFTNVTADGTGSIEVDWGHITSAPEGNLWTSITAISIEGYMGAESQPEPVLAISSLQDRQIIQRDLAGQAVLPIEGTFSGDGTEVQARLTALDGNGTDTEWITMDAAPADGTYAGTLDVTEGWYQLEVRLLDGSDVVDTVVIEHIGVGDIYITCGQSNAANFGGGSSEAEDDRVSYMGIPSTHWKHAEDLPENPSANSGSRGAPWPFLGDMLSASENVPVGFIVIADGGSEVYEWTVAANDNYPNLKTAVQALGINGFRAVLWHQGERDNKRDTSTADYVMRLESVIAQSRMDAGWNIPWLVAQASYVDLGFDQNIIDAQLDVIANNLHVFAGPDTDELVGNDPDTGEAYRHDDVHFSVSGLMTHAELWFESLEKAFPELETTGFSVSNQVVSLVFSGLIGEAYQLEATESLADPDWQAVTNIESVSVSPLAVDVASTNGIAFYRFRLLTE
ncbi:sialate O-acetylesterase [Pontiellaceae bacterium B1224]|nr:sialate O-acetylesterase [Pontiellaceae bacterium B1224]